MRGIGGPGVPAPEQGIYNPPPPSHSGAYGGPDDFIALRTSPVLSAPPFGKGKFTQKSAINTDDMEFIMSQLGLNVPTECTSRVPIM